MLLAETNDLLRNFLAISSWQSAVAILFFLALQIGFWFFLKRYKIAFMFRVISGMVIGLVYGIILQAIIGFPTGDEFSSLTNEDNSINYDNRLYWIMELNIWASLFKNIFINGVYLLTVPIVFLAIFKITSKPGETGLARITLKGVGLLLFNVALMFTITFFLGVVFKIGNGFDLEEGASITGAGRDNVPIPQLIWGYIPNNIVGALAKNSILPVMVIGALTGGSVKILSKKKQVEMEAVRKAMNTGWDIMMSVLMTFMKIMPLAVMSMMTVSLTSREIGALITIGKIIGLGYLGVFIAIGWLTLLIFLSGVKVGKWWKFAWRPLVQGFSTQSSNATLPVTMKTLNEEMKVGSKPTNTIAPLSTTMGLIACAGVQSGLATSILWTASTTDSSIHSMGLFTFFILALFVTVIASIGIAGVPGTATVVTVGVLGGLGFGSYTSSVLNIILPLDGLFDMGRTGANVLGGVAVSTVVAKSEGLIEEGSQLLNELGIAKQKAIKMLKESRDIYIEKIQTMKNEIFKKIRIKGIEIEEKKQLNLNLKENLKKSKEEFLAKKIEISESFKSFKKQFNLNKKNSIKSIDTKSKREN
ncbi:dicarboxylate/amino acid:cation symporter [Spiroplasma taiwanense]|uniref:L-cystine uptake protein TcyP n=1 Tax=Spiroplasma taiwanense CT-1 TaxID=1276220 RepID=S5LTE1_9MOLU|nr:dicarboxylate/amino acid:cation symporter [Spiroplasma taiwanense]AGR40974.1 proton/glutamate symporter [Spiroplasma taiwanense CT-1]